MLIFNRREYFTTGNEEELNDKKCISNTNKLSEINSYIDQVCQDNEATNRYMNDQRITCRNFVERQIFVNNDNNVVCGPDNDIPIQKLEKSYNSFDKLNDTGFEETVSNVSNVSNFPFNLNMVNVDLINLDNKQ